MGIWKRFLAYWRLDLGLVCALSTADRDYHDYPDDVNGYPWHMYTMTCKRCGKHFTI